MASLRPVWIVQDRDSGLFLFPDDGTVGFTRMVNDAGLFDSEEAAVETAIDFLDRWLIFSFFVREE
ncbi:hypothetical protein SAMN02745857_04329 [Andreprevotia lacus DSM 23236]|jgi:hypothetical protein|uniref:Uncharacterized protein n=1 Tax=Andreprevotia lacus DSM 23236 TaxID=1121001 RepID=A0A1W1Y1I0_9NEIS|nr:hypothetical protein [Andreprevotia lacus]SMC29985.1 hypothetical protein SAMN02745857_04329 [Andreprevotia lacus DSM 23236]